MTRNIRYYELENVAAVLTGADRFVRVLEELRRRGEAVKYKGRTQRELVKARTAVMSIDSMSINDAVGEEWESISRYEIVLGVTDELLRENLVEQTRYVEQKYLGNDKFEDTGRLTGWKLSCRIHRKLLAFGGRVDSTDFYVTDFVVNKKLWLPPTYSPDEILESLKKGRFFKDGFAEPKAMGDKMLKNMAKGLNKCLRDGVLLKPKISSPHRHTVSITNIGEDIYTSSIYLLSENAFSKLEKICADTYRHP